MTMLTLEDHLRDLRTALGLSLRDGAKLARMNIVAYGEIERGVAPKRLDVFSFTDLVVAFLRPHRARVRANRRRLAKRLAAALGVR